MPAEGVDELAGREPTRHGVDREVAPRHVVRDRDGRDRPTISKSRWPGPTLRSFRGGVSSIPAGTSARDRAIPRVEADPDELAVHLHVLDAPVRLERGAEPGVVDARDEEVLVRVRDPEQLVALGRIHVVFGVTLKSRPKEFAIIRAGYRKGCGCAQPGIYWRHEGKVLYEYVFG